MNPDNKTPRRGRPPKNGIRALTPAEYQKEYRERRKEDAKEFANVVTGAGWSMPKVMLLDILTFQIAIIEESDDKDLVEEGRIISASVLKELARRYELNIQ